MNQTSIPRQYQILLLRIILIGILFRLLHLFFISRTAFPQLHLYFTQSDLNTFWEWSSEVLKGDFLGRNPYHPHFDWMMKIAPMEQWYEWWGGKEIFQQSPLYPYFLAILRALFHDSALWIFFWQLMLGELQPWIAFQLTRSFLGDRTALVAALITALYGPFVFHQAAILRDWLPPLLEPLALLILVTAIQQERTKLFLIAGLALAIAVLAKERVLLWAPIAAAYVLLIYPGRLKNSFASAVLLIAGLILGLSPLIVRNVIVGAPAFSLSNRTAEGFIEANAAGAFPVGFNVPTSMGEILRSSGGKTLQVIRKTLETYHGNWSRFANVQWTKFRAIFDPFEIPSNLSFSYGLEISPPLRFSFRYGFLIPLAATGIFLSIANWKKMLPLYLYGGTILFGLMLSSVSSRQRLVIVPVLIVFASSALASLFELLRTREFSKSAAVAVCIVTFTGIQQVAIPLPELRERITYAVHPQEYLLSAQLYAANSDYSSAISEIQKLRARARNLGFERFDEQTASQEAEYHLQYADHLLNHGDEPPARMQLETARAILMNQKMANHQNWKELGLLYLRLKDRDQAKVFLQMFLEREPGSKEADEIRKVLSSL